MNRRATLVALFAVLVACSEKAEKLGEAPLPIGGPAAATDMNSDEGVVEYSLLVMPTLVHLLPDAETDVWAYNGQVPGPLLLANVGDTVRVHVTNGLAETTTVHWHGMRVPHAMDGVAHDGSGGIEPDQTFTTEFVARDAGSFWYHPHIRAHVQVENGLYGALVVRERAADAPDVDADRLFMLDDVRLDDDALIDHRTSGHDIMMGRAGNVLLNNGSSEPAAVTMGAGRTERWRLVNTANARTLELEFDGLVAVQIGADGGLWPQAKMRRVDSLVLPVGARAELQVRLPAGVESGAMNARVMVRTSSGGVGTEAFPLVTVTHASSEDVSSVRRGHHANPEIVPVDLTNAQTHRIELNATNEGEFSFTINGRSFPSYEPWTVSANVPAIIEIVDALGLEHPFHLHGQFFQVLDVDGVAVDVPGWRDVVLVDPQTTVRVATNFDNPGTWMYHCHILEHEDWGMMAMVDVVDDGTHH